MALITPRRRFLITAPLALLLPAGLLTYLGLQVVHSIENRYEQQVNETVQEIVNSVRNKTSLKLRYVIQQPFKELMESQVFSSLAQISDFSEYQFELTHSIPFAKQIFIYLPPDDLYFYERTLPITNTTQDQSNWAPTQLSSSPFINRLKSEMDVEIYREEPYYPGFMNNEFRTITYPNEPGEVLLESTRQLATFTALDLTVFFDQRSRNNMSHDTEQILVGFLFDFDYINNQFFADLLEEMWKMEGELKYPIRITDFHQGRPVATTPSSFGFLEDTQNQFRFQDSRIHYSRPFHDHFPWYWIYFSQQTGQDIMDIAAYEKIVYYCLIAAANLIMVVGVFGSLRNIAKELEISDMRSEFVARVSHELRTPLGLIRLYAETLEMDRTKDDEKRKEYLHAITKESERLTQLITHILNFSLIEAERKQYNPVNINVEDIIYETVDSMKYHIERYGFQVDIDCDPNVPEVRCDPEALQQALNNLLSNAMKYSNDNRDIFVKLRHEGKYVVLEVIDHGIGIEPDQQRKIFQEFFRVDDPRVRGTGGSGLGLALVKHIAESHGGKLTVESDLNVGSRFSIYIPEHKE